MGTIRSTISCGFHPSQTIIQDAFNHPKFEVQRMEKIELMKARRKSVNGLLNSGKYSDAFESYPFNSGYFICLRIKNVEAKVLQEHLLDYYGIGTISIGQNDLRIAYSFIEVKDLDEPFKLIYRACKELER